MNGIDTAPSTDHAAAKRRSSAGAAFSALSDAAHRSKTRAEYFTHGLAIIGRTFQSPYACLYVQADSQLIQQHHHSGATDPGFWKSAVERYLTEGLDAGKPRARLLSARKAPLKIALLYAPLAVDDDEPIGGLALVVPIQDRDLQQCMHFLDALTAFLMQAVQFVGGGSASSGAAEQAPTATLAQAAGFESPEQLAFSLTNSLRNRLGCEQVALALVRAKRCRILSISGLDDVKTRSPGVKLIHSAMEECVDLGHAVGFPEGDRESDGPEATPIIHRQWHQSSQGAAVLSIPFIDETGSGAVLSLRRSALDPFAKEEIDRIASSIGPFVPAFGLIQQARRGLVAHGFDSAAEAARRLVRRGHVGTKLTAALVCTCAAYVAFGAIGFHLTLPCTVAVGSARQVAAPFDAIIADVHVRPGDMVQAGALLCTLDTRDLELERRDLQAQLEIGQREWLRALAEGPPVEARLAEASNRKLQAKIDLVERRIAQAQVRSPIAGLVVQGDLQERVSGVVELGEPLFEIADPQEWMLEMDAPEWAVPELASGMRGRFACHAKPEQTTQMTVVRSRPISEVREGKVVYVVDAGFESAATWIRPGMQGVARIDLGDRPVWWVASFRVIDYLRLHYWL